MSNRVKVGIVGCGAISSNYLRNAQNLPILEIVACADLDIERARSTADEFGVSKACPVEALFADPEVEVVLNLTIPAAHAAVALAALQQGKHVYNEKPLALNRLEGRRLVETAERRGLRVGCAPDTFLGDGLQTARKAIEDGLIGRPVSFTGFMLGRGPESFHPDPAFFYQPGGGPMFDMGPYYLTALLNLLGPVRRIMGAASIAISDRAVATGPKAGEPIAVVTQDHVCGMLEFTNGAVGTLVTSFAVANGDYDRKHPITIYGTEGALRVPDPNYFDGQVWVRRNVDEEWRQVPSAFPTGYGRSVGLADLATAIRTGRPHRANGDQALAVLDLMQGFLDSSETGNAYTPTVVYERPSPMRTGLPFGALD
ncbi:MAG: Gfo/Idh/MocA family protein [Actinomycetota bacterium]